MKVSEADQIATTFEQEFEFLPDYPEVHNEWRRLLVLYQISGVQVHDTRLTASIFTRGVQNILTFNTKDFSRFTGLRAYSPAEVLQLR